MEVGKAVEVQEAEVVAAAQPAPEEEVSPCRACAKKGLHLGGIETATASHRPRYTIKFCCEQLLKEKILVHPKIQKTQ